MARRSYIASGTSFSYLLEPASAARRTKIQIGTIFRCLAASHLALALVLVLKGHRKQTAGRVTAGFLAAALGYALAPVLAGLDAPSPVIQTSVLAASLAPFAFWMAARVHFDDGFRLRLRDAGFAAALVLSSTLSRPDEPRAVASLAAKALGIALVGAGLLQVLSGARADLLQARLRWRYLFLATSGLYALGVLFGEIVLAGSRFASAADAVNGVLLYAVTVGYSVAFSSLGAEFLKETPLRRTSMDPGLLAKLDRALSRERIYREPGLTIAKLARRLGEREYKVREGIRAEFGFKNFNAFLHHYRIRDARELLSDESSDALSIAQIAFDLGYQSLGPFNKAFKELTAETPSEYRKKARRLARADPIRT